MFDPPSLDRRSTFRDSTQQKQTQAQVTTRKVMNPSSIDLYANDSAGSFKLL